MEHDFLMPKRDTDAPLSHMTHSPILSCLTSFKENMQKFVSLKFLSHPARVIALVVVRVVYGCAETDTSANHKTQEIPSSVCFTDNCTKCINHGWVCFLAPCSSRQSLTSRDNKESKTKLQYASNIY